MNGSGCPKTPEDEDGHTHTVQKDLASSHYGIYSQVAAKLIVSNIIKIWMCELT